MKTRKLKTPLRVEIGKRLKDLRIRMEYSTYELSEIVGISQSYLSHLEQGAHSWDIELLTRIATALDCHVNALLGEVRYDLDLTKAVKQALRDPEFLRVVQHLARSYANEDGMFLACEKLLKS